MVLIFVFKFFVLAVIIDLSICENSNEETRSLSEQKCIEYSNYVYENVTRPVFSTNGPITTKIDKCFKSQSLILDSKVYPSQFPHLARIGYGDLNEIDWLCSGTLISRRFILTAAHCTQSPRYPKGPSFVKLGDMDLENNEHVQTIQVEEIIVHPNYTRFQNDIALLKLAHRVQLVPSIRPACLNRDPNLQIQSATLISWTQDLYGHSNSITKALMNITDFERCSLRYGTDSRSKISNYQHLCAQSVDNMKDICESNGTGGPLQISHDIYCMHKVIGLKTTGSHCAAVNYPEVFMKVANYADWIEGIAFSDE